MTIFLTKYRLKLMNLWIPFSFLLLGCQTDTKGIDYSGNPQYSSEVEQSIEEVLNNLMIETSLSGIYETAGLEERMKYYNTPAVSIAVVNNGEIEWARAFGMANTEEGIEADTNTLFQAASISKPIFSLVVMRLHEQGILDIDKDVNEYLTSYKVPKKGDWQPSLSFRQLLSHTAGLNVSGFDGYLRTEKIPSPIQLLNGELNSNTPKVEVNGFPGTRFRYSGGGTVVAQVALTDLLKKSLPQIMDEELFSHLGLENSTYAQPIPDTMEYKIATGYPYKKRAIVGKYHVYPEQAPAGLWTNPTELAKIMIEIQKGLKGGSSLFKKETLDEMLTPNKVADWIGIGFFIKSKNNDVITFSHGGWNEGYISEFRSYRKGGKGVVVMINSNEGQPIINEIVNSVAKVYEWEEHFPKVYDYKGVDSIAAKNITGNYVNEKDTIAISFNDAKLFMKYQNQNDLQLFKVENDMYKSKYLNFKIQFANGELDFFQEGNEISFEKI